MKKATVILIGNEILSGRIQDMNLIFIAKRLGELGIELCEARVIPDRESAIVETVNACRSRYDYVFTTGGIGPTHDDITAASIAKAFGVDLERNAKAVACLQDYYKNPEALTESRLRMADMPVGIELLPNPTSGAPGFRMGNVFVMAGVPKIMHSMFEALESYLEKGAPIISRSVFASVPESVIAKGLQAIQDKYPAVDIGSYPRYQDGHPTTTIVARGTDHNAIDKIIEEVYNLLLTVTTPSDIMVDYTG